MFQPNSAWCRDPRTFLLVQEQVTANILAWRSWKIIVCEFTQFYSGNHFQNIVIIGFMITNRRARNFSEHEVYDNNVYYAPRELKIVYLCPVSSFRARVAKTLYSPGRACFKLEVHMRFFDWKAIYRHGRRLLAGLKEHTLNPFCIVNYFINKERTLWQGMFILDMLSTCDFFMH